jgi:NTE family protein
MSIGLVFSGGGGKGAYEIGVWKALEEYGIAKQITAVSGTSVGALNAALFAQGDYELAEEAWLNIKSSDILHFDPLKIIAFLISAGLPISNKAKALTYLKTGFLSRAGLLRIINNYFSFPNIDFNRTKLFASCTRLRPKFKCFENRIFDGSTLDELDFIQVLLASSAIPIIFGTESIESEQLIDGYFTDNTPVKPVYDAGARIIFTVFLGRSGGIFDDCYINRNDYPGATIINLVPQEDLGGLISGVLNFNNVATKIDQGYQDASKILAHHKAMLDSQMRFTNALIRSVKPAKNKVSATQALTLNTNTQSAEQTSFEDKLKDW